MSSAQVMIPLRVRERREVLFSFLASLLAHLLLLLLALVLLAVGWTTTRPPPPAPEPTLEVTFLPPPPVPVVEEKPQFIDSTGAELAETTPEKARFESDRDTRAASAQPAVNNSDLPGQEGREEDYLELVNQNMSLGPSTQPAEATPATQAASALPPATETPPRPVEEAAKPAEAAPEAVEESITPLPPDAIALQAPREVRRAEPLAPTGVKQETRRAEPTRELSREAAARAAGFQPERRTTRIQGGVNNRGRSSVEAAGTPLGRYKKALSDAIGSRWYFYVSDQLALLSVGTLTIRFTVLENGRVTGVQVLGNSSNESFASVSIRSIMEADIPPIPPEVLEFLENQRIEVDYTFSILGN